ncbi:hypothetical protein LXL04_012474 [Taraxacum kok-saghyz]
MRWVNGGGCVDVLKLPFSVVFVAHRHPQRRQQWTPSDYLFAAIDHHPWMAVAWKIELMYLNSELSIHTCANIGRQIKRRNLPIKRTKSRKTSGSKQRRFSIDSKSQETIVKMKEDECAKLVSAGTTISPEMEYEILKNVVTTVCFKTKTLLLRWESSSGPVMRKKDYSQQWKSKHAALEEEQHINKEKLRSYEEKVKQSEEKSEKLFQFVISKFLEAQDMLFPNHDMDEPLEEE